MKKLILEEIKKFINENSQNYGIDPHLESLNTLVNLYMYMGDFPRHLDFGEYEDIIENILGICDEMKSYDINSVDFLNPENIGFKDGKMAYFDIGFGLDEDDESEFDSNTLTLDEDLSGHKLFPIAKRIFELQNIESPELLGAGHFGLAFKKGDVVYKITTDLTEGKNVRNIIGINNEYLADYYKSVPFKYKGENYYYLELEYLETNPQKVLEMYQKIDSFISKKM